MFASVAHFSLLLAQAATAAPAGSPAAAPNASAPPPITAYLPFYLLFAVIFYFIFMRPQQRRAKEQAALLSSVRSGDEIVTIEVDKSAITSVTKASDRDNDSANVPVVKVS